MTIKQAIDGIDAKKPNTYTQNEKVEWLSTLDLMVFKEIILTHEREEDTEFTGYNEDTDIETELLVPAPYDTMYLSWLESRIDYSNGEYGKYNNTVTVFGADYTNFSNYYNRNHMPLGKSIRYF